MRRKRLTVRIDIDLDLQFWALFPAININRHMHELEFEWLCFGVYMGVKKGFNE